MLTYQLAAGLLQRTGQHQMAHPTKEILDSIPYYDSPKNCLIRRDNIHCQHSNLEILNPIQYIDHPDTGSLQDTKQT
jgi:hypothetical protein